MTNPGLITEQGYAAGSFGFQEASKEEVEKLAGKKKDADKDQHEDK